MFVRGFFLGSIAVFLIRTPTSGRALLTSDTLVREPDLPVGFEPIGTILAVAMAQLSARGCRLKEVYICNIIRLAKQNPNTSEEKRGHRDLGIWSSGNTFRRPPCACGSQRYVGRSRKPRSGAPCTRRRCSKCHYGAHRCHAPSSSGEISSRDSCASLFRARAARTN